VNIANTRVRHNEENQNLSCANVVQFLLGRAGAQLNYGIPPNFEQAISRMNFVQVASMDCLDSSILCIARTSDGDGSNDIPVADCSVTLSIGRTRIYACKDSFLCFTETINELITEKTMPSSQELDEIRTEFFASKATRAEQALHNDSIESDSSQECGPYFLQKPSSLSEVIDNGLFASSILQEDSDIEEERDIIHNFFETNQRNFRPWAGDESSLAGEDPNRADENDWTEVHHSWASDPSIPSNEEQAARWYTDNESDLRSSVLIPDHTRVIVDRGARQHTPHLVASHIPVDPVSNPITNGDMGALNFAGCDDPPKVKLRVLINDMSLDCRLFDGLDWKPSGTIHVPRQVAPLIDTLLDDEIDPGHELFPSTDGQSKNISRHSQRYFQVSFSGLNLRMDSFDESADHSLASCTELALVDFFLLETVSGKAPVKLMGEWVNGIHPRDSNDGLVTMKMVSILPSDKFSSDGELMGNESRVTMELLPIRFFIHQIALRFIRNFFQHGGDESKKGNRSTACPPELFFPIFKVRPVNIKVDYKPKQIDTAALKDGSLVELLNVLPLEDMILRLSEVEMRNLTGWGSVISELACNWLQDVSSTQMHKFLTRTTPLHPFATIGDGMKQFLMIPLEEYKQEKGNVKRGLRKGTKQLASVLAYETLSVGAKLTGFAAKRLGKKKSNNATNSLPRSMDEVSDHAIESLTRGLKEANAKMIIIPYREYQQTGTKGAVKSVVRGLPVAVCAPLSGAAEAVSYGLYGVRNQLRPDLREEEEVSKRFHDLNF